ncbi:TetR/AcrR family transcriptional regulator [Glycomyces buryatensis]|uniref:TetR/AcrR family transcriptional regulator n=1 Tax=Glycomyces buryatensis TaxID=2570927 RepID=A0A4S8QD83_9ACTN|nr:TetR/AcrR family transcriptional regulator [Glycomyces buryatensis]THV42517.1 TetR/AcrR family transcriptional regulator [Glycomyces buryatensis]
MPTGIAIHDGREQLFAAAERILLRDGPSALTSRAVTEEAGVSKGLLHRHFADFDDFLAEFVLASVGRMDDQVTALLDCAGTGTVTGNLTDALIALFDSLAVAIVPLVTIRDGLRERLRETWPAGVPVLTEGAQMIAEYLTAERELGRIRGGVDVRTLAATLLGGVHLLFADRQGPGPEPCAVGAVVNSVVGGVLSEPGQRG